MSLQPSIFRQVANWYISTSWLSQSQYYCRAENETYVLFCLATLFQLHALHSIQHNGDIICFLVWLNLFLNCIGYRKPKNKMVMNDQLEKRDRRRCSLKDVYVKQVKKNP